MAWRDNLLPASLDGVEFLYKQVGNEVGRRTVVHEFPGRDEPFTEDLGRAAQRYQIQAFLIGENYASAREELIAVLESGGSHDFLHPYRGFFTVNLEGTAKVIEKDDEGRFAQINFTLVESGFAFPLIQIDTAATVGFLAAAALEKLGKTKFNLLAAIGAVLKSIANGLNKAGAAMRKVNGKIAGALNLVDNISGALDAFTDSINDLLATPGAIMNELNQLMNSLMGLVKTVEPITPALGVDSEGPDVTAVTLDALESLTEFSTEGDSIPTPTPQSAQEVEAHAVITKVMKASALITATDQLADQELESANQADSIVDNLAGKFDDVLQDDFEPEIMEAVSALKAATVAHFTSQAQQLPAVRELTINYAEPTLVMAHRLYGSDALEKDIIKRNKIRHPAFVPAGVGLEVLSSG